MSKVILISLLLVFFVSQAFADGNNNDCQTTESNLLGSVQFYEEKIDYDGDVDWYKGYYTSGTTPLHVVMIPPNNKDYDFWIYDSCNDPNPLQCSGGGTGDTEDCMKTVSGDFYVRVYGYNHAYNQSSPYEITAGWNNVCSIQGHDGHPLWTSFGRTDPIVSINFGIENQNSFGIYYYFFSQLYRPAGAYLLDDMYFQLFSLPGSTTQYKDFLFSPLGGAWPEPGNYKHKSFVLAYCPQTGKPDDVSSKNAFSTPDPLVEFAEQRPNLQVADIWTNVTPYGGQPVKVYVRTTETNGVNAPVSCTRLLADGNTIGSFCQSISGGGEVTRYSTVSLPAGIHTLTGVADYWGEVTESNENDNTYSEQITWQTPRHMNSQVENLRQRYYTNEGIQYDSYLRDRDSGSPLDGVYVTTINPFTHNLDFQNTSQQGRYWFNWTASSTGLKQFTLNYYKNGYYSKYDQAQITVIPETARLYASVFNSSNKPVWGAKFKLDGEDRGAAGRNGQLIIHSEKGNHNLQVLCPNNNACYSGDIYLDGSTQRAYTCNCPNSNTNVVLNLTAFSDALPPDNESISANGLPIINALVSVDGEFDSLLNATDAGGFLKVNNIPYRYHDFDFYYCLDQKFSSNGSCANIWHSYSRANIQSGTQYINFALNVDTLHAQDNSSSFESYSYKNGKLVMTGGKYEKKLAPLLVFAGFAIIGFATSCVSEYGLRQAGCFHMESGTEVLDLSRSDCQALQVVNTIGLSEFTLGATGLISLSAASLTVLAPAAIRGQQIFQTAVEPINGFIERHKFWGENEFYDLSAKTTIATGETSISISETISNLLGRFNQNLLRVSQNSVEIGGEQVTRDKFNARLRLEEVTSRLKELYDEGIINKIVQSRLQKYAQQIFVENQEEVIYQGEHVFIKAGEYNGKVFVYHGKLVNGRWVPDTSKTIAEFDHIRAFIQQVPGGQTVTLLRGETASRLDQLKEADITKAGKERGIEIIKKLFSERGTPITETVNVVIDTSSDPYTRLRLEAIGWIVKDRGLIEEAGSLFDQAVQTILRWS